MSAPAQSFDPDDYLSQQVSASAPAFDPDAYLKDPSAGKGSTAPAVEYNADLFRKRVGRDPEPAELANFKASKGVGWAGDPTQGRFTAAQAGVGAVEDAVSLATGIPASIAAAGGYMAGAVGLGDSKENARAVRGALTYQPRTQAGQAGMAGIGQIASGPTETAARVGDLLDPSGLTGDTVRDVSERVQDVTPLLGVPSLVRGGGRTASGVGSRFLNSVQDVEAPLSADEVLSRSAQQSPQSMGAASAAPRMTNVSPELQQAVVSAYRQTGGAVNPDALARHIEADSLPVKIQLTPGQALQDPATISQEMNNRARTPGLPDLLNRQNKALTENIQAIRDQVGPDVFSANPVEHGDALIEAYNAKDEPIRADISAKYQALKDANGGEFPVDGQQFVANADRALKSNMKRPFLPAGVESTLQDFRNGDSMTFENFENLRTTLASEARKAERSGDGNAAAAVNLVREQLEKLPMSDVAAPVKALADEARSAAKARFDALKADPAYKAAVEGSVEPDDFVRKFVINGKRDDVALMRENLKDNPTATQTMGVAILDHLRRAAGIDDMGNNTFSQANYNKALQALGPKVSSLLDPETTESLQTLGNVARYTQAQPKGSYVNNSNTLVGALGEHAMSAGENLLNAKTGIGGTVVRRAVENRSAKKAAQQTMTPYGGLNRLSDVGK